MSALPGSPRPTPLPLPPARPLDPRAAARQLAHAIVLDARDPAAFARGHVRGAGCLPPAEFAVRRAELPPRTAAVLVVHDDPETARAAAELLVGFEYRDVAWLAAPLAALAGGCDDRAPAAPLWRASPFVARVTPRLAAGRALDFACGAGRESVHLALHGWQVESWDHDPDALAIANALAARHGVALTTRVIELEEGPLPEADRWDTIVVCRFLHRPLWPWLERALAPGGTLVYETFRRGQEAYGRPLQDRFLLESGELAGAFPTLRVDAYEESTPPGGPVMAHLLARAPAAGAHREVSASSDA